MRKKIILIVLISMFSFLFGANNVVYLRQADGNWRIGILKGGNLSVVNEIPVFSNSNDPVLNPNNEYLFCEGDFDGDNRSDVALIYNSIYGHYHLKVLQLEKLEEPDCELLDINLNSQISDLSQVKFLNSGDFDNNNDGVDELVLTYTLNNGIHTSCRTISVKNNTISNKYDLTNNKPVLFTTTGDYDKDYKDELCVIFDDENYQEYITINCSYNDLNGPWQSPISDNKLTNKNTMGEIKFVNSGDYNGDGNDELVYVYLGNEIYKTQTFDVGNSSWNCIANEYQLFSKTTTGIIKNINSCDFDEDEKDELNIVYENISTGFGSFLTITADQDNRILKSGMHHNITNSSMGNVYNSLTGDFNGDGLKELCYYYKKTGESRFKNKILNAVSLSADVLFDEVELKNAINDQNIDFYSAIVVNSTSEYDAKENDKSFTPIPLNLNSSIGDFHIGWYGVDEHIDAFNSTNSTLFLRDMVSVSNWDGLNDQIFDRLNSDKSSIMDLVFLKSTINEVNPPLNSLNKVIGFLVGADFIFNNDKLHIIDLYNYVKQHSSDKFTYAAETSQRLMWAYDDIFKDEEIPFNVPIQFEYIYMRTDGQTPNTTLTSVNENYSNYGNVPNYTNFKMTELLKKCQNVSRKVKKHNNQYGYIYKPQGHSGSAITDNGQTVIERWGNRNATYKESRFEVYTSIVSGSGGLLYWNYKVSDPIIINNLNNLTNEIKNNSVNSPNGSIHKALINGHINNAKVFSSYDGYDRDASLKYAIPIDNMYYNERFIGNGIDDLQYILREDNGTYYIISVNTSPNTLTNVKFYCQNNIPTNVTEIKREINGNWNTLSHNINGIKTEGDKIFNKFNVTSYDPYEVKIFRLGDGPSLAKQNSSSLKIENLEKLTLKPVYPNPFNPITNISFELPKNEKVTICIYNTLGELVTKIIDFELLEKGMHQYVWNGVNSNNHVMPSGIYFIKIFTEKFVSTQKVILLK